jgi:DNA modification methylase
MTEDILTPFLDDADVILYAGDCIEIMRRMPASSVDAIITDPPYGLEFMGKGWDSFGGERSDGSRGGAGDKGILPGYGRGGTNANVVRFKARGAHAFQAFSETWAVEAFRILKPGGHLLAFAGTRTYHRMASGVEDAGFEIRDCIAWMYGSGFPKSLDVSKAIDKHGGASIAWFGQWFRQWRETNKITQKEVASLFPSKTGGLTGCVANWELGLNMPTPDQFNTIRDTFGLPFDSIFEAEREVVGKYEADMGGLGGERLGIAGGNITAPATPEAEAWNGWGTALKPAFEPVVVARRPLIGTVAQNVLEHGTGALNIDACRIGRDPDDVIGWASSGSGSSENRAMSGPNFARDPKPDASGRWPANVALDATAAAMLDEQSGELTSGIMKARTNREARKGGAIYGQDQRNIVAGDTYADTGGASRFFYTAKASRQDRTAGGLADNTHPTVKPTDLMRWLIRLVTPPGGIILDPFGGSGSTGLAARAENVRCILIEREPEYLQIIRDRLAQQNLFADRD